MREVVRTVRQALALLDVRLRRRWLLQAPWAMVSAALEMLATGGMLGPAPGQRFIYMLEGKLDLLNLSRLDGTAGGPSPRLGGQHKHAALSTALLQAEQALLEGVEEVESVRVDFGPERIAFSWRGRRSRAG